jgi:hypothetical protein
MVSVFRFRKTKNNKNLIKAHVSETGLVPLCRKKIRLWPTPLDPAGKNLHVFFLTWDN